MKQQSGNDELNGLGYASSAPDFANFAGATQTKPQDEADLPTLIMVGRLLENRLNYYRSTDSIALGDITVENQLIINKKMVFHIQELQALVNGTVARVKEKLNERG